MSSFIRTPAGLILHADNHRALLAQARALGLHSMIAMLEPAEPIVPLDLPGVVTAPDAQDGET